MASKIACTGDNIPHPKHSILRLQHADNLALAGLDTIGDPFTFSVPVVGRCVKIIDTQIDAARDDLGYGIVSQAIPGRGDFQSSIAQGSLDNFGRRLRKRLKSV